MQPLWFPSNQVYMFRAMFSPIIRSISLQLRFLVLPADVAVGWRNTSATPASSNIGGQYQKLQLQWYAPDDGRKHLPKLVELIGSK